MGLINAVIFTALRAAAQFGESAVYAENTAGASPKKPLIGGQAVLEGVMMKSPTRVAVAVRRPDKTLALDIQPFQPLTKKYPIVGKPVVRGVVNFVQMLSLGMRTLAKSTELGGEQVEEPTKFEKAVAKALGKKPEDVMFILAAVLAVIFAVGLFFVLPTLLVSWMRSAISVPVVVNILEGLLRIAIFLIYLGLVTRMKEIRRVFSYHGAEHKTVHCFEHDKPLIVENAQQFSVLHPRCGTSLLLVVFIVSLIVFTLVLGNGGNVFFRVLIRLALLPVIAGLSYEILQLLAKFENGLTRALRAPGLALQRFTTSQPDDDMVEVAIVAFNAALDGKTLKQQGYAPAGSPEAENEFGEKADDGGNGGDGEDGDDDDDSSSGAQGSGDEAFAG